MRSSAAQGLDGGASLPSPVQRWLVDRSTRAASWPVERLLRAKGATRVSVLIPARDEEATVGAIVDEIRRELVEAVPLVDELIVIDSRSRDATAAVAAAAGAGVIDQDAVLPHLPTLDGKGDALWKGLVASTGDLVVFVDADVHDFTAAFVTGLLGPLLGDPGTAFVKGFYHRPLVAPGSVVPDGGGRVSELVARPLIALHWPELAGFVQPLGGEYAGRRSALEQVPFVSSYGVEVGLLIDLLRLGGLSSLAQVDLGVRRHTSQSQEALGAMAGEVVSTVLARAECGRPGHPRLPASGLLTQFRHDGSGFVPRSRPVAVDERPPMAGVAEYRRRRAGLAG